MYSRQWGHDLCGTKHWRSGHTESASGGRPVSAGTIQTQRSASRGAAVELKLTPNSGFSRKTGERREGQRENPQAARRRTSELLNY